MLVTGGAGFIGSNFVLSSLASSAEPLVNVDKLTYAGNLRNLDALRADGRHTFVRGDRYYTVFCFAEREHAELFREKFGGEMIHPKDRPRWPR